MVWIIFLAVIGIMLCCVETFLPGMVVGSIGGLCLISAVIITYIKFGLAAGNLALVILLAGSVVAIILWVKFFPKTRGGKMLITEKDLAESKTADSLEKLMGKMGKAATQLRPAGSAQIEGSKIDVVAESGWIESESPIKVVLVEGNRVVVRKI
jgi:membrane-bound serine protease (ClpP class)